MKESKCAHVNYPCFYDGQRFHARNRKPTVPGCALISDYRKLSGGTHDFGFGRLVDPHPKP